MWDFLKGTKILDLSRLLPGPYAMLLLADLGAEVVKIEELTGDPLRQLPPFVGEWSQRFAMLNRNKKSLALNLKAPEGLAIFHALARQADVVVETFRPGVTEWLGIGYELLQNLNSRIVYCSLTGYGQTGPYRDRAGHDLNYLGVAGLLSLTGHEKPEIPGVPVADLAGGMGAALTILAALQARARTGQGTFIDLSMTDVVFSWLTIHLAELFGTGAGPSRAKTVLLGAFPCYAIYETSDGKHLTLGALEPKFWRNFCSVFGRPNYSLLQYSPEKREEIFADLCAVFKTRTREDWLKAFSGQDVPIGPVNDLAEAVRDPQIERRQLVSSLVVEGVKLKQTSFPAQFIPGSQVADQPPPRLGQHTREILQRLDYTEKDFEGLRDRGVIRF